jgi:c-di-GMP-binding flagellar brake protein YcgR
VVSIRPEESKTKYFGESVDFSETGMSFTSEADFHQEQNLEVGFVNPGNRKRLLLTVKIVRKIPKQSGGRNFYGVMFADMSIKDIRDLLEFITGKSEEKRQVP